MDETEYFYTCPHCWEEISIMLDSSVPDDDVEAECELCGESISIHYSADDGEIVDFSAEPAE